AMRARSLMRIVLNRLAAGVPARQLRATYENRALFDLQRVREMLFEIQSIGDSAHPRKALIPELEEIIDVCERTLELIRPPAAA
ncbi:hypothetical protein PMAYCL1PPCAC_10537, partial [Pristionchus mayeri]